MELADKSQDVEFGDPDLMKWDFREFLKVFRPMPPEMAESKTCEMRICGGKYILPSDRVIYLTPGHLENRYRFDFEIAYGEHAQPSPGKLVFIKNNVYTSCERQARYFHPDPEFDYQYLCGVCCGKEELPADRPTLTIRDA